MIAIINYNMGNPLSIKNMLSYLEIESLVTNDLNEIRQADRLILPGVGSFDTAMKNLDSLGLISLLHELVLDKKIPILGICLGMQLLTNYSEEGNVPGFRWIDAETKKFNIPQEYKVPHMGWNTIVKNHESRIAEELEKDSRFYFVHSFYVQVKNQKNSSMKTTHYHEFDSAIEKDNIFGVQFHPEKSHKFGMKLLKNFSRI